MRLLGLVLGVCCLAGIRADITGTDPPLNSCICLNANGVNVRDGPCGPVMGSADIGDCYTYNGNKEECDLSGTTYEYFDFDIDGSSGWIAGLYMDMGSDLDCGIVTPAPDPEFRSYFIATAWNVDWPDSSFETTADQQSQMLDYLNLISDMNMNAIVFQVRPAADAFYASAYEPWSKFLTGTQGVAPNPYYDPLEYTVTQAHARGIEVHAWLNPYRGNLSPNYDGLAPNHICNTLRQYCYIYDNYLWLDPGATEVVDHLVNVVTDIVQNYAVDGIHFDDYFYPYPDGPFPDDATYQDYLNGGGSLSLEDWRRDNVNTMVSRVYNTIRGLSSTVVFSISPFGIYRPGHPEGMPSPIAGLDPYTAQFADPKLWLQSGWVDFLGPQLYWAIDPPAQSYPVLLDWWLQANTLDRYVYAATAIYKMADGNNWPVSEIVNQVGISRDTGRRGLGSLGNIHYSAQYFKSNTKGVFDEFQTLNPTPASVPPMPWFGLDGAADPVVEVHGNLITWRAGDTDKSHTFTIYRKVGQQWQIVKKVPRTVDEFEAPESGTYAVRAANGANEFSGFVKAVVLHPDGKA